MVSQKQQSESCISLEVIFVNKGKLLIIQVQLYLNAPDVPVIHRHLLHRECFYTEVSPNHCIPLNELFGFYTGRLGLENGRSSGNSCFYGFLKMSKHIFSCGSQEDRVTFLSQNSLKCFRYEIEIRILVLGIIPTQKVIIYKQRETVKERNLHKS